MPPHEKYTILFTLVCGGKSYAIQTYKNQYYSLMVLINDHLPMYGFGLCCGMGSCGTCLVEIAEKNSLHKRTLLACGVQVNDDLANTVIHVSRPVY